MISTRSFLKRLQHLEMSVVMCIGKKCVSVVRSYLGIMLMLKKHEHCASVCGTQRMWIVRNTYLPVRTPRATWAASPRRGRSGALLGAVRAVPWAVHWSPFQTAGPPHRSTRTTRNGMRVRRGATADTCVTALGETTGLQLISIA